MNNEEFLQFRSTMGRPIPGQSLTNDPENPLPFEQAPRFTDVHDASMYLWSEITDPELYVPVMTTLADGTAIMDVAQTILMGEFQRGAWNPDLMMMLVEPLVYMYIALAERLDIDVVIYNEEDADAEAEEKVLGAKYEESKIKEMKAAAQAGRVPEGVITSDMEAEMATLPELTAPQQPSLMAAPEPAPVSATPSLMAAPQEGL
jgi:hypothetical protein